MYRNTQHVHATNIPKQCLNTINSCQTALAKLERKSSQASRPNPGHHPHWHVFILEFLHKQWLEVYGQGSRRHMFACFKDMPCCMCAVVFLGTPIVQIVILVGLTTAYHCYGCAAKQSHLIQWAPWPIIVLSMAFPGVLLLLIPSVPCPPWFSVIFMWKTECSGGSCEGSSCGNCGVQRWWQSLSRLSRMQLWVRRLFHVTQLDWLIIQNK